MTKAQERAIEHVRMLATDQLKDGFEIMKFEAVEEPTFVSLSVWYQAVNPYWVGDRIQSAQLFIGPRGGISIPYWTKAKKLREKKFDDDLWDAIALQDKTNLW